MDTNSESEPLPPPNSANDVPQFAGLADPFGSEDPTEVSGPTPELTESAKPIDTEGTVEISKQFWKLDQRNIQVDRISGLIFAAILMTAALVGALILFLSVGFNWIWFTLAGIAAFIVLMTFVLAVIWPALSHRNTSWRLDEEGLEIRHGVLWKHRLVVPLGRVQHADVSQGPLQRQFGVGTLTIHTAGTQHASIPLEGLSHETAIQLRDLIVHQKKDQNVV